MIVSFALNGKAVTLNVEPERRLVDLLREEMGLTRTKVGCYAGECAACTVLLDGEPVASCLVPAFTIRGSTVVTYEGFARSREHTEIVRAFAETGYSPCDFCAQARILAVYALLAHRPEPSEQDILAALSGIGCQCSDASSLVRAVNLVAYGRKSRQRSRR